MGFCVRSRISLMLRELRNAINRHSGLDWEEKGINLTLGKKRVQITSVSCCTNERKDEYLDILIKLTRIARYFWQTICCY